MSHFVSTCDLYELEIEQHLHFQLVLLILRQPSRLLMEIGLPTDLCGFLADISDQFVALMFISAIYKTLSNKF